MSIQLIGLMVYLNIESDTEDLYLFINSLGSWVIPRIAIYDTMQFVQSDVHLICMGFVVSMGSFILVGGEITKRLAFPQAYHIHTYMNDSICKITGFHFTKLQRSIARNFVLIGKCSIPK
ncbi:hypothetical protein Pint_33163 [Pistacia integerrima]|uniref:Uncharacterized protein n=1 Tax=Pistacia integerrima TaxID=434235 RepID=A0ACC0X2P0_9ROSI|nr:hypothetical protein Pint_33163 [Pistacia integerrima]